MVITVALVFAFCAAAFLAWGLLPDPWLHAVRQRIYAELSQAKRPSAVNRLGTFLVPLNRRLPHKWYSRQTTKILAAAGLRLPPLHFLAIQEIGALMGIVFYVATLGGGGPLNPGWLAVFMALGFFVPVLWIRNRIKARRLSIARDLPEVADLLNLCVGAGSDFVSALGRIVREFRPCPVREELALVLQEIRMGKRRRDALRSFSERLQTIEVGNFTRTLIQVDRMGTGLAESLAVLSEDMRLTRYHWAERYAQQAPMKMLLPLILSLASAMIIVAGPILLKFFRGDLMMGPNMTSVESR